MSDRFDDLARKALDQWDLNRVRSVVADALRSVARQEREKALRDAAKASAPYPIPGESHEWSDTQRAYVMAWEDGHSAALAAVEALIVREGV